MIKNRDLLGLFMSLLFFVIVSSCTKEESKSHANDLSNKANIQLDTRGLNDCMPNGSDYPWFQCTPVSTNVFQITLNDFPNCILSVSVPIMICNNATHSFLTLGTPSITGYVCTGDGNPNDDFPNLLQQAINGGTIATQNFLNPVYAAIYNKLTHLILAQNSPLLKTATTVQYVLASCVVTCLQERYDGPFSYFVPVESPCGTNCCKRIDQYIKINGIWVLQSSIKETSTINCIGDNAPSCPGIHPTDCYGRCDIFNDF